MLPLHNQEKWGVINKSFPAIDKSMKILTMYRVEHNNIKIHYLPINQQTWGSSLSRGTKVPNIIKNSWSVFGAELLSQIVACLNEVYWVTATCVSNLWDKTSSAMLFYASHILEESAAFFMIWPNVCWTHAHAYQSFQSLCIAPPYFLTCYLIYRHNWV